MKSDAARVADRFLILLITVDAILIVLHILRTYTTILPEWCGVVFSSRLQRIGHMERCFSISKDYGS